MRYQVTDADTAAQVGSGDVPVLATPRLIAWLEAATVQAAAPFAGPGQTTVGTVEVTAEPLPIDGRLLTFQVKAIDDSGQLVARGEIDRVIVDRQKFLGR